MRISIGIATHQRAHLWKDGRCWKSILAQTRPPDEVLICDDASMDETLECLQELAATAPFPVRLFQCQGQGEHRASALAQNVMFAEASGELYLSLDDDLIVHPKLCEFIEKLPPAYYAGEYLFCDPVTLEVIDCDLRIRILKAKESFTPIPHNSGMAWGSLWAAPLSAIRRVGGHDMNLLQMRGSDSRIGHSLQSVLPAFFVRSEPMQFRHLGLTMYRQALKDRKQEDHYKKSFSPSIDGPHRFEAVVNGGQGFWLDGRLQQMYREVTSRKEVAVIT